MWGNPHHIRNMFLIWDISVGMVIPFLDLGSAYKNYGRGEGGRFDL
jgi:hypothetical protein